MTLPFPRCPTRPARYTQSPYPPTRTPRILIPPEASLMARRITRRQMLGASAASLGYLYGAPTFSAERIQDSNGKLRVAGIGVGGKGSGDIDQAGGLMEVVALCDVDEGRL